MRQDPGQYTKRLDTEIGHFGHFRKQICCRTNLGIYPEIHGIAFSLPLSMIALVSFGDYLETLNISVLDAIFVRTQYLTYLLVYCPGSSCGLHFCSNLLFPDSRFRRKALRSLW